MYLGFALPVLIKSNMEFFMKDKTELLKENKQLSKRVSELEKENSRLRQAKLTAENSNEVIVHSRIQLNRQNNLLLVINKELEKRNEELETLTQALSESEGRYRRLLEFTPDAVIVYVKGEIVYINPAGVKLLKASDSEEIIGKSINEFHHSDLEFDLIKGYVVDEHIPAVKKKFICLDGREIDVELVRFPFYYNNEFGVKMLVKDITEKLIVEKMLWESNELSNLLLNALDEGAMLINTSGIILYVNIINATRLKKDINDLMGRYLYNFIPADLGKKLRTLITKITDSNKEVFFEEIIENRHYACSMYPVSDNNGNITKIAVFNKDITEKKKFEEDMIRREKLESLSTIAGGIAHNFNNILMGIMSYVNIAKLKSTTNNEMVKLLQRAEELIYQAKDISEQLLNYAKGSKALKVILDMNKVVKKTLEFSLAGSNIKSYFSAPSDTWKVKADYNQITQAINNIILNAKEVMPKGGSIDVALENISQCDKSFSSLKQDYVKISFQDHGSGIEAEHLSRIFDPYFTTKSQGTGLGLSTTYSIIKRHDGYMEIDSEIDQGSCFHIFLPANKELSNTKEFSLPMTEKTGQTVKEESKAKILILDDEEETLNNIGELLRDSGYNVTLCKDGTEVLLSYNKEMESGHGFDVVLLDLTVPDGMGGLETLMALDRLYTEVKAIAVSGNFNDPAITHYKEYGFLDILTKPYSLEKIKRIINTVKRKTVKS